MLTEKQRNVLRDVVLIIFLSLLTLSLGRLLMNAGTLNASALGTTMNDQAGYLSVARHFAESGMLESDLIYPSTLNQNASRNYLYMPGYYIFLGLSMKLFGGEAFLLPGYLAFVVSVVCIYLISTRLYDRKVGLIAAVLFCVFPSHMVYATRPWLNCHLWLPRCYLFVHS